MPDPSGGQLLASALAEHGVGHVSSLHGGHLDPFWDACHDAGIRLIDVRHEQAAVHLAEGWAWATGRPGVAAVTAGPGVTDAFTGIVNAQASGAPVVVLAGRIHSSTEHTRVLQDLDIMPFVSTCTKQARTVRDAARISEFVGRAFLGATAGRPGPAFLEVPAEQLARRPNRVARALASVVARPGGDPAAVDRAADAIGKARRPVILAGSGVHWSGGNAALQAFVEHSGVPVLTHSGGRGTISDLHPLCLGSGSPVAGGAAITALSQADCIVVVGARFNFTLANGTAPLFAAAATVIRVDIDDEETSLGRPADIAICGDAATVLIQLHAATPAGSHDKWLAALRDANERNLADQRSQIERCPGIHPLDLVHATNDVLGTDPASVVVDGGEIQVWGLAGTRVTAPGRFLSVGPLGTLGIGPPFAMATKLARPSEPTVLISGDGAFGFNGMELESAVRHNLPLVCIVSNDRSWGMSRHGQGLVYGYDRVAGTELAETTRYDHLCQALGGRGWLVSDRDQLRPALTAALDSGEVACLDVRVSRDVVSPTTRMIVGAGAGH